MQRTYCKSMICFRLDVRHAGGGSQLSATQDALGKREVLITKYKSVETPVVSPRCSAAAAPQPLLVCVRVIEKCQWPPQFELLKRPSEKTSDCPFIQYNNEYCRGTKPALRGCFSPQLISNWLCRKHSQESGCAQFGGKIWSRCEQTAESNHWIHFFATNSVT